MSPRRISVLGRAASWLRGRCKNLKSSTRKLSSRRMYGPQSRPWPRGSAIRRLYAEGALLVHVKDRVDGELRDDLAMLKPEETAVLTLLVFRLGRVLKIALKES